MASPSAALDKGALLCAAVETARLVFQQAIRERDRLLAITEHEPGYSEQRTVSIQATSHASVAYARALTRYRYYLVTGKSPPETHDLVREPEEFSGPI
jgi:hypothetical protein